MKKIHAIILLVFSGFMISESTYAQTVIMGDGMQFPENSPADCNTFGAGGNNFYDDGGPGGNYSANFNDTVVFCPDLNLGTKMAITFGINAGYTFDVDGSDFIYVYDGPNTSAPLLGIHNSVSDPNGFTHIASWNNPSGCLTVVFISDGANQGTGWTASVQCGNQAQPFEMHLEAFVNNSATNSLNPIDTGFVDVCLGDSILLVAKPLFPYSVEATGYGYSQNVNNVNYSWNISDGGTYPNNDSVWFVPPTRNGFIIELKITDAFPYSDRISAKVRVSQQPIFAGTGPVEDTVCLGQNTLLIGGVTPTDTVGITIPDGTFQLGGAYAGLTYLPDGSGQNYVTTINISGFPSDATIQNAQDLNQVCITMEHSYTGDLEIWLECPPIAPATTGLTVNLLNSYNPGVLPGGISGGSRFLGHPYDDAGGGGAGEGWEYCFSSIFNTIGPMNQNWTNTISVPFVPGTPPLSAGSSMNPADVYAPESSFGAALLGCPVNGDWKIHVRDNLAIDDGYIFEWGLYFDPSFFPGLAGYSNHAVNTYWNPDPTIVSGSVDTLVNVVPNQPGSHSYTYNLVDDYGCHYDTTVTIYVLPLPVIFPDTIACDMNFQVSGTQAYNGGIWSAVPSGLNFSSATVNNPHITASGAGIYAVSYIDNACSDTITSTIIFPPYPHIFSDTSLCGDDFQVTGTITYPTGGVWSALSPEVSFLPNNTTINPTITASTSGQYQVTYTDNVCNNSVSAFVTLFLLPDIFPDTSACNFIYNVNGTVAANGGVWSSADTNIHFSPNANVLNPVITSSIPGTFEVTFTDNQCNTSVTSSIKFIDWAFVNTVDTVICIGATITTSCGVYPQNDMYVWSDGTIGHDITASPGVYTVTASNRCNSSSATMTIDGKVCYITAPNIIVLSSTSGNNKFFLSYDGVDKFHISIVNRWGNLITEYSDPGAAWDGRNMNGEVVSEGTYFYKFTAKMQTGEEIEQQGFVQVFH
ncbi:gliding motility-associated C-terminal domain-containing protein [Fluviicola sp.]|jgi:subtilisin-like proprotein convertase family protein|uniref:T9SS type B sorting domain-containing protein n=1 Tax=Fluviicola sp. TaxID=1917219 RepID=UPI00282101F7|nr:gliding motility-associated C-terminal domain-containing protein [Fluviicola sp.]MDR0803086.1 gliding motility-associated C-terminal domain-containing protein [Fluviicola sp.]